MLRKIVFSTLLHMLFALGPFACVAQAISPSAATPPPPAGWTRVEALHINTKLHIKMDHGNTSCRIYSVADDTLTCANGKSAGQVIQRYEIRKITVPHYLRSTLTGLAIGIGAGAITGYAIGNADKCKVSPCFDIIGPGAVALVGAVGFGAIGAGLGAATDFTRGGAIYVRP